MTRSVLIAVAIVAGLAGCGERPQSAGLPPSEGNGGPLRSAQSPERPEITPGRISKDVVGRVVTVPELSGAGPSDRWTFEAGEYRRIDIVERRPTAAGLDLLVFMLTRSNPGSGDSDVQVSGQLRLHYEWKSGKWVLRNIENVSFRYTLGVAT